MTYPTYEASRESGTPVELYEFVQGLQRWNYTSSEIELVIAGQVYTPYPIVRDRIKQNQNVFKDGVKLTFPRENQFASQFMGFSPEEITTVIIRRGHADDPDEQFIVYWKGRVSGSRANGNKIDIDCESIFTSIRRPGLRAKFEYGCRHVLYGPGCRLNREVYKTATNLVAVSRGVSVTLASVGSKPDGYYTGGILLTDSGVARFITNHTGLLLTIARPSREIVAGVAVSIYPGCNHQKTTCNSKFNNLDNFGGFPFIPQRNPFDGGQLY